MIQFILKRCCQVIGNNGEFILGQVRFWGWQPRVIRGSVFARELHAPPMELWLRCYTEHFSQSRMREDEISHEGKIIRGASRHPVKASSVAHSRPCRGGRKKNVKKEGKKWPRDDVRKIVAIVIVIHPVQILSLIRFSHAFPGVMGSLFSLNK